MIFTKFQKGIIKTIIKYNPIMLEVKFKELFEYILNKYFVSVKIKIKNDEISLNFTNFTTSKEIIRFKNKFNELLILIEILSNNYNFFYNIENFEDIFLFNSGLVDCKKIIYKNKKVMIILENLQSDYFISSDLYELNKLGFKSIDFNNLNYTRILLWVTIFFSILSFGLDCYNTFCNQEESKIIYYYIDLKSNFW